MPPRKRAAPRDNKAVLKARHDDLKKGIKWNVPCIAVDDDDPEWECRSYAIKGGTYCRKHGGDTAHNIAVANQRLSEIRLRMATVTAPKAARFVERAIDNKKFSPETRLKAATTALAAVGIGNSSTVTIQGDIRVQSPIDILVERLAEMNERKAAAGSGAIDVEVLPAGG